MPALVLTGEAVVETVDAAVDGDALWLSPSDLLAATGWSVKPSGLCREEACVPLPPDGSWTDAEGRIAVTEFADRLGWAWVHDAEHDVWVFGSTEPAGGPTPAVGEAPDFTLRDLEHAQHSLSDFRGKKVFLFSWGSYCGCSLDLPVWQVLYEELKDQDFEILGVAMDTAGDAAVADRIRAEDIDERPDALRAAMGWSREIWARQSPPQYTCLIDEDHILAELYGMTNVPMAVWIDEEGRLVRPAESAGYTDHFLSMDRETFELPEEDAEALVANREVYFDALRDWVARGPESPYALTPEEIAAKQYRPSREDSLAALHVRIGHHLFEAGETEAAKAHFNEAVELAPDKWTYRRQSMMLDPEYVGELHTGPRFWSLADARGDAPYNAPIDMPGISG